MNVSGFVPDISKTESVIANRSELTVTGNGLENLVTIRITTLATTGRTAINGYKSGSEYIKVGRNPTIHLRFV